MSETTGGRFKGRVRSGKTLSQKLGAAIVAAERIRFASSGDVHTVPLLNGLIRRLDRLRDDVARLERAPADRATANRQEG